jgi:hypothetical protein
VRGCVIYRSLCVADSVGVEASTPTPPTDACKVGVQLEEWCSWCTRIHIWRWCVAPAAPHPKLTGRPMEYVQLGFQHIMCSRCGPWVLMCSNGGGAAYPAPLGTGGADELKRRTGQVAAVLQASSKGNHGSVASCWAPQGRCLSPELVGNPSTQDMQLLPKRSLCRSTARAFYTTRSSAAPDCNTWTQSGNISALICH